MTELPAITELWTNLRQKLELALKGPLWPVDAADFIIHAGWDLRSSDLHAEISSTTLRISARVAGRMLPSHRLPFQHPDQGHHLLGRFKVLAQLPAYILHDPQDGRIDWTCQTGEIRRIRLAALPTADGALITLRFPVHATGPNPQDPTWDLEQLGFPAAVRTIIDRLLAHREGLLPITGPAGSGKTTTLLALLARLHHAHQGKLHLLTIEDPVEHQVPFATQIEVHEPTGRTYESCTRAALRHGPDVLLIGELRDPAAVTVALAAALSGHLVLTTIHAGRAAQIPNRLRALQAPAYLLAATLQGALAQRLVTTQDNSRQLPLVEVFQMDENLRATLASETSPENLARQVRDTIGPLLLEHQAQQLQNLDLISPAEVLFALGLPPSPENRP